ncbi:uncharacterized protein LOC127286604 [Leptopilina boulardi]|uniref:uncharacterized protein LOC127286604 n=1 Tax=Leptopilina boulardi TaxID=63433 RepID=UPI0021F54A79|nr:uncharacterized protein LOC127286604 [Leptopilina boulardi]
MSEVTNKSNVINNDEPPQKRIKYSPENIAEELKILENREIKTGFINCTSAVITIDDEKIDLLNIDSKITSKIKFTKSSSNNENKEKSLERQLSKISCPFTNYIGQSITTKLLGENYHAIPDKFIIYRENDYRQLYNNINEKNVSKFLIVISPTNYNGGEIIFPQLKKTFKNSQINEKQLNYILFNIKTKYEISKITHGICVLLTFKIIETNFEIELKELTQLNTDNLKSLLKNLTDKNILIPITEGNIAKKICDDIKIKYRQVYADEECPKIVYDDISDAQEQSFCRFNVFLNFEDLIDDEKQFSVNTYVNPMKPQKISDKYTRYRKSNSPKSSCDEVEYYSFLLINPCREFKPKTE